MSNLVESFHVTITLKHDEVSSSLFHGERDLKAQVQRVWDKLAPWFCDPKGKVEVPGIVVEWSYTGLEEQHGVGDN